MLSQDRIVRLLLLIETCLLLALSIFFVFARVRTKREQDAQEVQEVLAAAHALVEEPQAIPVQPLPPEPVVPIAPIAPIAEVATVAPVPPTKKRPMRRVLIPLSIGGVVLVLGALAVVFSPILTAFFTTHVAKTVNEVGLTRPALPVGAPIRYSLFEAGIVTPQWQTNAFGTNWQQELPTIQTQTGARWIELPVLFSQDTSSSTNVATTQSTPNTDALAMGIRAAHAQGLKVFVVPLLTVQQPGGWAGSIQFSNQQQEQVWFDNYWTAFQPYVQVAAQQGAEQIAVATECAWLQAHAPADLWNQLIARVHAAFKGKLTYDMNWWPSDQQLPTWFSNAQLSYIGVSAYIPLSDTATRISPAAMVALWHSKITPLLDAVYDHSGKPVLVSEIGYRNSADALYQSWDQNSKLPSDQEEQAGAFNAALSNVITDTRLVGIFFWGWDNVNRFGIKGNTTTIATLHQWYTSPSLQKGASS